MSLCHLTIAVHLLYQFMKQDWRNISFHKFYIQTIVVNLIEGFILISRKHKLTVDSLMV